MTAKARYEVTVRDSRDHRKVVDRFYFKDYWDAMTKCDLLEETINSLYFCEFRDLDPFKPSYSFAKENA